MNTIQKEELNQLVTEKNIAIYREYEGITTPEDLDQVHAMYHRLIEAHDGVLELMERGIDPEGTFDELLSPLGDAVDAIGRLLNPTGEDLWDTEAPISIPDSLMNRAYQAGGE